MFLSSLVTLHLSSLSDVFGSRYPLLFSPLGTALCAIPDVIIACHNDVPLGCILIGSICCALTGGNVFNTTASMGYLAASSSEKHRTTRLSFLQVAISVGFTIGRFISGPFLSATGYAMIFGFCGGLSLLSLAYAAVRLKESQPVSHDRIEPTSSIPEEDVTQDTAPTDDLPRRNIDQSPEEETSSHGFKCQVAFPSPQTAPSPEPLGQPVQTSTERSLALRDLFRVRHLYMGLVVMFRQRQGKKRKILLVIFFISLLGVTGTTAGMWYLVHPNIDT